jgi:NAD(P)-dependent dehydrogenase (short-subunit alcohol dehydrogenase family)
MQINDRVFLVTGASSGIGLATAEELTARGARVALLARSSDALQELAERLPGSLPLVADVTDFEALRAAIANAYNHFGRIDGLVNNAGQGYGARLEEIDPELFEQVFRLNVLAPIVAMQTVLPLMRAAGEGAIVNVNSGTAFMTIPGYGVYSASKRALLGITQTARAELARDGVVISEVYPTLTATNFGANRVGTGPDADYSFGDPPAHVAGLIAQAIEEGGAEYFANDYLRSLAGRA